MKNAARMTLIVALAATFWISNSIAGSESSGGACGWNGPDQQCEGSCDAGVPPSPGYAWACAGVEKSSCQCTEIKQ